MEVPKISLPLSTDFKDIPTGDQENKFGININTFCRYDAPNDGAKFWTNTPEAGQMDKFVTLKFKRTGKKEIGSQG